MNHRNPHSRTLTLTLPLTNHWVSTPDQGYVSCLSPLPGSEEGGEVALVPLRHHLTSRLPNLYLPTTYRSNETAKKVARI